MYALVADKDHVTILYYIKFIFLFGDTKIILLSIAINFH